MKEAKILLELMLLLIHVWQIRKLFAIYLSFGTMEGANLAGPPVSHRGGILPHHQGAREHWITVLLLHKVELSLWEHGHTVVCRLYKTSLSNRCNEISMMFNFFLCGRVPIKWHPFVKLAWSFLAPGKLQPPWLWKIIGAYQQCPVMMSQINKYFSAKFNCIITT